MKQTSEIKLNYQQNETKLKVVLIIVVLILSVFAVTAFFAKIKVHPEKKTRPKQIAAFDFPTDYPVLEVVDPEERVLFEGFRTSFLPDEELMLCHFNSKSKRDLPDDNDTSDITFLWDFPEEVTVSTRLKRKNNSTSNNDTTRFRLYSTDGKKKKEIGSKSADHDNNEFEDSHVAEENADDDHYEEGDMYDANDEEDDNYNVNDEKGDNNNEKYEDYYEKDNNYNENYEKGDINNKNYEDYYEKGNREEDDLEGKDYEEPHSDYPNYFIKEVVNARNSSEEGVTWATTKLKRKCMNDSNNDIEVPYYYFEDSKREKNNSVNFMSEKDGEYDIGEEDFRDYDEPHVNKGNISRYEHNATDNISKHDEDYEDGDIYKYKNDVAGSSEKEIKETICKDEEDEDIVVLFPDANIKTNSKAKGDKNCVEKGGKKTNKTNSIFETDKDNVEKGRRKENNETIPNGKEDANYLEKVEEEVNYVEEDDIKVNNKTNSINKGDKDYVEKEEEDYVEGDDGKANNKTNSINKGDKDYVEKEEEDYVEGEDRKVNNKTNSINKEVKDYIEKGARKEYNVINRKGKEDANYVEKGNRTKKGIDKKTNSIIETDKDSVENGGSKENNKTNPNGKKDANDVEGGSSQENNETNIEGKEDNEVYEKPEDELDLKKGVNNEIDRGSGDRTPCKNDYDDYNGEKVEKERENNSDDQHQDGENEGIERNTSKKGILMKKLKRSRKLKRKTNSSPDRELKSSKRNCSKPKGSRKSKRKTNATSKMDSGSDNETSYDDDYDYYSEGDEEQKDGDNDKSDDLYQDNENEGIESMVRPETHVDRGPLDDVVEQVRGQPELEEGEMPSSVHLYKPVKLHSGSGIHALFKGQGDKNTIRATQASIMRRNMDAEADPCQDFYQYACGNWAALNPIPADKAGYDTFEMLRENLDSILKDLLEFSKDEQIKSKYPGPHLDLKDNLLKGINYQTPNNKEQHHTTIKVELREVLKGINKRKSRYHWKKPEQEQSEIVNRIRNILNRKPRATLKQLKAHHTKTFHSMIRQPYQRHKRRFKQKRLVKQSLKYYPRRKFTLKRSNIPDTVLRRRKIQAINGNRKHRPKREVKSKDPGTPSNNGDKAAGDAAMKARFLFKSCMNYGILQNRGHQPLLDLLNLLGGWPILDPTWHKTDFDWLELMAKLRVYNNDILISEWVGPDIKNSDEFVIQFDQTSLGLPTREYFLQDSNKVYLNAYKNYLIKIALLLGGDKHYVEESAEKLIDFEIKLAKITSAPEDRRNVSELYRRMTLQKLENMVPEVKWRRYLCVVMNRTVYPNETVVLFALNYVRHLVTLINKTDSSILSNYLLWRFVRHRVNNLDDRFQSAKQQFYFILFGREQAPPRWKNCISQVNSNMGMALGSMFVKKYFDETSKNDTLTMTREIQQSFRELLHKITWIDNDTKKLAAHKVDAMMLRIGYPNFILSKDQLNERYKEVRIHPDKYFENILNILQHLTQMEQSRIGQPVNKTLWNTAPAVVNAYYSRNKNQIMFPAGILQPPFYHRHFPRSLNYGGIGVVIGHEITHGFDDKGRLFDCNGNLHRWWSDTAIESFHRRAQCLIDQYGQYVVPEVNMKLDGINTQGENIADNGGVKQAFRAYKHWVQQHGTEGETLPGLNHTHTQLFFLNFAQVWCGAMRPEAMRNKLKTAVHSPGRFRVIGTLSNSVDFAREFKCPPGSAMNPTNKCTVW